MGVARLGPHHWHTDGNFQRYFYPPHIFNFSNGPLSSCQVSSAAKARRTLAAPQGSILISCIKPDPSPIRHLPVSSHLHSGKPGWGREPNRITAPELCTNQIAPQPGPARGAFRLQSEPAQRAHPPPVSVRKEGRCVWHLRTAQRSALMQCAWGKIRLLSVTLAEQSILSGSSLCHWYPVVSKEILCGCHS